MRQTTKTRLTAAMALILGAMAASTANGEYIRADKAPKTYHAKLTCVGIRQAETAKVITAEAAKAAGIKACGTCYRKPYVKGQVPKIVQ